MQNRLALGLGLTGLLLVAVALGLPAQPQWPDLTGSGIRQVMLAGLSLMAVVLSQSTRERRRRCACIAGLLAQPWWFFETLDAKQWGMLGVTCAYTAVWAGSFWRQWVHEARPAKT